MFPSSSCTWFGGGLEREEVSSLFSLSFFSSPSPPPLRLPRKLLILCLPLLYLNFFFIPSVAIHYNPSSKGLAVATSEQIALLPLKNK